MNSRRTVFIALAFLAAITACGLPGFQTESAPQPTLTVDAGQIETMVAGTVSAAIAQTEQARPTSTPIPTSTFTSIPTATATATSTLAPSPTVTAASATPSTTTSTATLSAAATGTATSQSSPAQSTLIKQADGLMLFTDERAHYEIKLPAGWTIVRVNEKEYPSAFLLAEAANVNVQQALLGIQNEDPNVLRLFALDTQAGHIQNEFVSDMRFVLDGNKSISLSSDADLQAIAAKISASAEVFRFEVTSVKVVTSASGKQFGVIETKSSFMNASDAEVGIYQKRVFFNVKNGTQSIILTTLTDLKNILLPTFDAMLETIKVYE
jgi:hypothetical protein